MACKSLDSIIEKFNIFTEKPVKYLTVQKDLKDDMKSLVKSLYDYTKTQENVEKKEEKGALPELIVQDFDEEQIWQEIELQNSECWDKLVWEVANSMSIKNDLTFPVSILEDNVTDIDESASEKSISETENAAEQHNKVSKKKTQKKKIVTSKPKVKSSVVDDKFFKLQEMEKFLISEEKQEGKVIKKKDDSDSEESIDMFEDIDDEDYEDEEGGTKAMYSDFFNQEDGQDIEEENSHYDGNDDDINGDDNDINGDDNDDGNYISDNEETSNQIDKKVRFAVQDDKSSDDESGDESDDIEKPTNNIKETSDKKSEFELCQQRLKKQIDNLEQKTLSDAAWQLKGEVDATKRPQNSLLEEIVDFDLTSRPPPIITEQTTVTLEDLIKRRIKDKAWDDVVKKEKPVDDQLSFRKTEILDHAKSKLSLAQVYEAEYLKQKQALSGDIEDDKEPEKHTEIRKTMNGLFAKLDALCHYHYTPRAPQAEVKIVSNTPAISMEEVAPVAASDATLLAPEEIKKKRKGELISKEERTQTDKNRERRKKKKFQREKGKVQKVTEHRNTKTGTSADDKSLKTSTAFFQQLNDESRSLIKKRNVKNKGQ